tara:strand:+ start:760 stop:1047 length:288 start_codon:yes stop_codon:yes gene_type:complete
MIAQKFTESIADVMRYIVNAEMGGEVDSSHRLFRTYLDLRDIFEKVKGHNETLDLQTHAVFKNPYSFEESDKDRYYHHPEEKFNRDWYEENLNKQ